MWEPFDNGDEFKRWDVIMFVGQNRKLVVQEVMDSHYALLELPIGNWPYSTPYSKEFCHWNAVKVGEWDNPMRREIDEA